MFFYPPSNSISKQTEITGMSEAIVNFSASLPFELQETEIGQIENDYRYVSFTNNS
jgi:hypothetical protein